MPVTPSLTHAIAQTWPPFVLIAGLLMVGVVAASDRLFEAAGAALARLPGGGWSLFVSLMALVAAVTVVLNLDTSVVFLTPIVLHAARRRRMGETAFLYGVVFLSNSASLLLPGSNLTNLLVIDGRGVDGRQFVAGMAPSWAAAVVVTMGVILVWRRRDLMSSPADRLAPEQVPSSRSASGGDAAGNEAAREGDPVVPRWGAGIVGITVAAVVVVTVANPALPVLGVGLVVAGVQVATRRIPLDAVRRAANPLLLGELFALAVALGTVARLWGAPARLMASAGTVTTAAIAVLLSCALNNLPTAVLLSSAAPAHPRALLIGLNLGPNLAVTGSLAAIFWLRVARGEGARPSVRAYTAVGLVLVPLTVAAALAVLPLASSGVV